MSFMARWLALVTIVYGALLVTGIGDPVTHGRWLVADGAGVLIAYIAARLWGTRAAQRIRR